MNEATMLSNLLVLLDRAHPLHPLLLLTHLGNLFPQPPINLETFPPRSTDQPAVQRPLAFGQSPLGLLVVCGSALCLVVRRPGGRKTEVGASGVRTGEGGEGVSTAGLV